MNTVGTLGAVAAGWLRHDCRTSLAANRHPAIAVEQLSGDKHAAFMAGFNYNFMRFAAAYFIAALCWRFIDSTKPIVAVPQPATTIMTRQIVRPDKLDLESPGRRDYWVALEHDSIWGDHLIPLTVFVGPQGPSG